MVFGLNKIQAPHFYKCIFKILEENLNLISNLNLLTIMESVIYNKTILGA